MRLKTKHAAVALGAAALLGCASEVQPEVTVAELGVLAPAEGLPTVCDQIHYEDEGKVSTRDEWYSFSTMNRLLEDDEALRREAGISRVENCDQARTFSHARTRYIEGPNAPVSTDFDQAPQTPVLERADAAEEKIKNGRTQAWASVVRINAAGVTGCTATLLSGNVLITSAHCIPKNFLIYDTDGDGTADAGSLPFFVEYDQNSAFGNHPLYCLTAPGGGNANLGACAGNEWRSMTAMVHPDYTGEGDYHSDLALVISSTIWNGPPGNQSAHWRRINTGGLAEGHDFRAIGAGANANGGEIYFEDGKWRQPGTGHGVLRDQDIANIDYLGAHHFHHTGDFLRMCKGDSGGPAIDTNANALSGVYHGSPRPAEYGTPANPVPACAVANAKMRWTRVNDKVSWMNSVLQAFMLPLCTAPVAAPGGVIHSRCYN